ncbi:hypothetical protein AMTRI_Chr06g193850 [Amborella trichopoda]
MGLLGLVFEPKTSVLQPSTPSFSLSRSLPPPSSFHYLSQRPQNYTPSLKLVNPKPKAFKALAFAPDSESGRLKNEVEENLHIRRKKLAVFVSGGGSNFKSLHEASLQGRIHGEISVVVTDKPGCGGSEYANEKGIPVVCFPRRSSLPTALSPFDLITRLREFQVDFLLLAGFLKLVPVELVQAYPRSILNIHPSLLPSFGGKGYYGLKVHKAVIASGARYSGPTIHFVDEHFDTGRILAQRVVPVLAKDTPEELAARVLHEEHQLYVEVVEALCEERIVWRNDGVPLIRIKGRQDEYW